MKQLIDTLIISDIHLGSSATRTKHLLEMLDQYNFNRLIINGDIFDDLNFKRLHSNHWDVLSRFRTITREKEVIWINGNHDGHPAMLSNLLGIKIYHQYSWRHEGKKYLAIHGHQFDRFLNKNFFISALALSVYSVIKIFDSKDGLLYDWVKRTSKKWLRMSEGVAKGAIFYAGVNKADYIFCGHTHIARIIKKKNIEYYNSGCWVAVPSNYIIIYDGIVELKEMY